MDPVSNANRIAMMLRARLAERAKAGGAAPGARAGTKGTKDAARKSPLQDVEAVEGLDDRRLKRALIEDILADQFGAAMVNEARFQQVVDQVAEAIEADAEGKGLFARVVADLRSGAR